jgi:hypothetical protein
MKMTNAIAVPACSLPLTTPFDYAIGAARSPVGHTRQLSPP